MSSSYLLPDDVFEPGEKRPSKGKKTKAGKATEAMSKKRTVADAKLDVRSHLSTRHSHDKISAGQLNLMNISVSLGGNLLTCTLGTRRLQCCEAAAIWQSYQHGQRNEWQPHSKWSSDMKHNAPMWTTALTENSSPWTSSKSNVQYYRLRMPNSGIFVSIY